MDIVVIDGQGGGIGKAVIEKIRPIYRNIEITAIGTNSIATSVMLKAGADCGATGENSVVVAASKAKVIIAPIGLVISNSLIGEVTPKMAAAVGESDALKLFIPSNRCNNRVLGTSALNMSDILELITKELASVYNA